MSNRLNKLINRSETKRKGNGAEIEETKGHDTSTAAGSTVKKTGNFGNMLKEEDQRMSI